MRDFADEVRIAKLKLSGLRDSAIAGLLPGAPSIADEVCDLLDDLLVALLRSPEKAVD
jgi:hypothetical protein